MKKIIIISILLLLVTKICYSQKFIPETNLVLNKKQVLGYGLLGIGLAIFTQDLIRKKNPLTNNPPWAIVTGGVFICTGTYIIIRDIKKRRKSKKDEIYYF